MFARNGVIMLKYFSRKLQIVNHFKSLGEYLFETGGKDVLNE
jgi:hypothetical protein